MYRISYYFNIQCSMRHIRECCNGAVGGSSWQFTAELVSCCGRRGRSQNVSCTSYQGIFDTRTREALEDSARGKILAHVSYEPA
ncbi:hypothetical protein E2C01_094131 [Portunus trituberculatus]|uniref:Uncharacterized protein n=1 Tax=Portunus trituberculatus TaxID=210409 RepID=A0A5B7JPL8_PORTR|nr:hypothetical protein [Portunus trituberculatus]